MAQHGYGPLRRLLAGAAIAVAALALACGGGDPAPSAPPTAAPAPAARSPSPTPAPPAFPLTIEDSDGTAVTLDAPPRRIVSYSPGATEILFAIGAGGRVVATDEFSDYPEAARRLPRLAYSDPDPEAALALAPDLVLMAGQQRARVGQFRDLGMTVLFLDEAVDVEGVIADVETFGEFTGAREQAAALAASMRARAGAVAAAVADAGPGPRVFFELTADLYTAGPDTFVGNLLTLAGAENVAAGAETRFPQLSAEAVVAAAPEVVLLADAEWGESRETVCARPGWDAIPACVSGRVHPVGGDLVSRPGPRVVDGLEQVARLLHPERFP